MRNTDLYLDLSGDSGSRWEENNRDQTILKPANGVNMDCAAYEYDKTDRTGFRTTTKSCAMKESKMGGHLSLTWGSLITWGYNLRVEENGKDLSWERTNNWGMFAKGEHIEWVLFLNFLPLWIEVWEKYQLTNWAHWSYYKRENCRKWKG